MQSYNCWGSYASKHLTYTPKIRLVAEKVLFKKPTGAEKNK